MKEISTSSYFSQRKNFNKHVESEAFCSWFSLLEVTYFSDHHRIKRHDLHFSRGVANILAVVAVLTVVGGALGVYMFNPTIDLCKL